jgi:hypothetical protein
VPQYFFKVTIEKKGLLENSPHLGELWSGRIVPKRDDEWKNQKGYLLKAHNFVC